MRISDNTYTKGFFFLQIFCECKGEGACLLQLLRLQIDSTTTAELSATACELVGGRGVKHLVETGTCLRRLRQVWRIKLAFSWRRHDTASARNFSAVIRASQCLPKSSQDRDNYNDGQLTVTISAFRWCSARFRISLPLHAALKPWLALLKQVLSGSMVWAIPISFLGRLGLSDV